MADQQIKDETSSALRMFARGQQDVSSTVRTLVKPVNQAYSSGDSQSVCALLECLWAEVLGATRDAPDPVYTATAPSDTGSASMDQYASLLDTIRQCPHPPSPPSDKMPTSESDGAWIYEDDGNKGLWSDLLCFSMQVRKCFNDSPASSSGTSCKPEEWTKLNGFLALLTSKHTPPPSCFDFTVYAIWTLRETLETSQSPEVLDVIVPAAAAWIRLADSGTIIHDNTRQWQPGGKTGAPARTGPLYDEGGKEKENGFSKTRWSFWQRRFGQISGDERLGKEARDTARAAVLRMQEIEGSASNGKHD